MTETAIQERLQAGLDRARARRFDELGTEALAWLALPPVWTDRLARACGFPQTPLATDELLSRAERAGWCVRRESELAARTPSLVLHLRAELARGDEKLTQPLLEELAAVEGESLRARLLAVLAADATPGVARRVRSAARTIGDAAAGADVLLALATAGYMQAGGSELRRLIARIEDPRQRAPRMLRACGLVAELDAAWLADARSLLDQLGSDPTLAARLLRQIAGWLPAEEALQRVERLEDELSANLPPQAAPPPGALADLAATLARCGRWDQALSLAESIRDERARARAKVEMLSLSAVPVVPPAIPSPLDGGPYAIHAALQVAPADRGDLVTLARLVERLVELRWREPATVFAERLLQAAGAADATPANAGALQQAAAAGARLLDTPHARTLLERSATLAAGIADPAARTACLAGAVELARRLNRPDPVPEAALVEAAREIHDDEDRAWALARVARLVRPRERIGLAEEALALAAMLERGEVVVSFWAPAEARERILEELRRRHGFTWVQEVTATIARQVQKAQKARDAGAVVPASLARWAALAEVASGPGGPSRAAAALDQRVGRLLESGETGQALTWLDSAGLLGPLLLGDFETSVLANTRRVELVHRRELDRRRLADFLPRPDQLHAFEALLEGHDVWALHYLGVGGVGKTMLIRHLTAELAPERGLVTSRIDFDHLSPDFPSRRPAQLLLELMVELEAHAQGRRHLYLFRQGYEQLQEINAAARPGAPPVTVSSPAFARAIRTFGGFLESLEAPVVLILDTCEELEKLQPTGGRIEQLEATFELIEALHDAAPRLRVVLAGRRPLARGGRGWRLAGGGPAAASLPEAKPYLALHEVRGFDRAEAVEFLARVKGLRLDAQLLEAILERSPDPGAPAALALERPAAAERQRYNPFDLDHYANWARAEPSLRAAALAAAGDDAYVQARIVGRLRHAGVERLLPAVVALGRFDREMLRPAFDGDQAAFAQCWRELAATEWVDIQPDAAAGTTFLEVHRALRPRLEAHYRRPEQRGLLHEATRRLGPELARMVDERPLERLGTDHVAGALRLLPPAEAARLVDRLAWKVIEERAWGWAELVAERLLVEQPGLGDPDHPAAAGLRAMLASATLHLDPERDLGPLWESVERAAPAHPDPETGRWLALRAALGRRRGVVDEVLPAVARLPEGRHRQVLVGGLLAALYELLDAAEASNDPTLWDPAEVETVGSTGPRPEVRAFVRLLTARVLLVQGRLDQAERIFGEALAMAAESSAVAPGPWFPADWLPPDGLVERAWLEALRVPVREAALASAGGPPPVGGERLGGIEQDRLASAALRYRLDRAVVPAEELAVYERLPDLLEPRRPACRAHRAVPPFFVTVARGWVALGRAEPALALLRRGRDAAIAARDQATARLLDLALLEVARRLRLPREARSLRERLLRSEDPEERRAAWAAAALLDPPETLPPRPPDAADPPSLGEWIGDHPLWWKGGVRIEVRRIIRDDQGVGHWLRLESETWVRWLGGRRVAELLLEEGELLALESPARAGAALDLAAERFEQAGDPFGAFAATVAAALARARAGQHPGDTSSRLERAYTIRRERAYTSRRERDETASLPEWSVLTSLLGGPGGGGVRAVPEAGFPWFPWMDRLLVALAWATRPEALPAVVRMITRPTRAASPSAELSPIPAADALRTPGAPPQELAGAIPPGAAPAPPARGPAPSAPPARAPRPAARPPTDTRQRDSIRHEASYRPAPASDARARRGWLKAAATVAAIAAGAAGVALVVQVLLASGGAPNPVAPGPRGASGWLVTALRILGATVAAVGAGLLLWRRWPALHARLGRRRPLLEVRIASGPGQGEPPLRWSMLADGRLLRRELGGGVDHRPYQQQRDALPAPIRRALPDRPRPAGIALQVDPGLAATPWEAPILLAMDDLGVPCWRELPLTPVARRSRRPWPWPSGRTPRWVLASPTWAGLVETTLRKTRSVGDPAEAGVARALLAIVGVPVQTSAGLRLLTNPLTRAKSAPRALVEPDGLPYERLGLVVVMGEPSESLVRVDAEREQAADLRRCAADLATAGAAAVLCLPAMPVDRAERALRTLDRRLGRIRRGDWRQVCAAAASIREEIATAGRDPQETAGARELALEVTVFVRH